MLRVSAPSWLQLVIKIALQPMTGQEMKAGLLDCTDKRLRREGEEQRENRYDSEGEGSDLKAAEEKSSTTVGRKG